MTDEFKNAFKNLSLNEKRNQISNEMLVISELIKNYENILGISSMLDVKNFDLVKDANLSEDEMLDFIYENIYNIQREIITILSINK